MSSASDIVFLIIHTLLNPYVIGLGTVGIAACRELYPRWDAHPMVRAPLDLLIVVLLLLLLLLAGIRVGTGQ